MASEASFPNFFAGAHVDRRTHERVPEDWVLSALEDPRTLFLIARGTAHLMHSGEEPAIAFLHSAHPLVLTATAQQMVLLGWFRGARCVLVELESSSSHALPAETSFEELRPLASQLPAEEASLLAYARALSYWRARTRFCSGCGAQTNARNAGHTLLCSDESCGLEFFPRIDPAIIVLVTDGERALLGRQASWPAGRYSTLAGFVEPGESLEDAVVREVMEETGVQVFDICYHSSQPWPFPSSLMLGFEARAHPDSTVLIGGELEDVRWFTPGELASGIVLPPPHSISYRLITSWLQARADESRR